MTGSNADFIIIGAGVAGLSVAAELAGHGRVIVLEQEPNPAYHSTGRSAAIFVDSYGDEVIRALTAASRPFFDQPTLDVDVPLLGPRGLLHVVREGSDLLPNSDRRAHLPRLTITEIAELVPPIRHGAIASAYWEANASDIDVHALQTGLIRKIRANGGLIVTSARVIEASRNAGMWSLKTQSELFQASTVINAAGAWAGQIGTFFGATDATLVPLRRTAALTPPPEGVSVVRWPMVVDLEETVYFKPEAGNLMISPADETPCEPHDAFADEMDIAIAAERFEALVHHRISRISHRWAGLRTFARDRRPVIGFDGLVEGFFWVGGQGGFGVQTAFGAALLAKQLLLGGGELPAAMCEVAPLLSPRRFDPTGSPA